MTAQAEEASPLLRFTCVSDLHLDDLLVQGTHKNRSQFRTLLSAAVAKGYSDLFLCGGDVSSYGDTDVWYEAGESVTAAGYTRQLWALGNHAYGTTTLGNPDAAEDFKSFAGVDSIYYHTVVNGIHFLCMAAEESDFLKLTGDTIYSDAQLQWLERELAAAAADSDGKPIFIVSHYPMESSGVGEALLPLLPQYQNVFFLWGHDHSSEWVNYSLENYVQTDQGFTKAWMGSLQYGYTNQADTLLVDVYADRVVLTYDRTDGNALSPDSVTVPLAKASWNVSYADNRLSWCVPLAENVSFCVCTYDAEGKLRSCRFLTPTPCKKESVAVTASSGMTKVFFWEVGFCPLGEASCFPACLELS